ncbi:MAG TPA: hypothetical protein VFZ97_10275 [Acidimicrobiales bacterium]
MTKRHREKYVDSLLEDRRPPRFDADPDDAEFIRTAITLRAARGDLAAPRDEFMSGLFDELAAVHGEHGEPPDTSVAMFHRPRRAAIVSAAAAAVLIGGTFGVTEAVNHGRSAPAAVAKGGIHSSVLLDVDHRAVGRVNLYGGSPAWVFMNLNDPGHDGTVVCQLRGANGNVEVAGAFQLTGGEGEFARTIKVNLTDVRSASIVTSTGITLATATFS